LRIKSQIQVPECSPAKRTLDARSLLGARPPIR
jgi:hypothetical protein